ncbi:IclR family transcriptional regulator [Actinokineospora spheciospongiae]|uniref:IclR family transcriptional regulator n=1 Tax=Actinokineospora spheciospongiae TaxID=909613 RepID=UPI000D7129C4|nr:IclR family transcriptional regulator [Actinokineospora spheciospongiae]PWW66881.1 IclR family transcriptional regulator [Actinokineospora spheciospongiae]
MPGRIQSVERAAAVLRLLAAGPRGLGVGEVARALRLPKGTVHGILQALQHVGFVEQDRAGGEYRLGATLLHLGTSYLDGNELRTRALNRADSLASRTRESVRIGAPHEGRVLVVHHVFRPDDSLQVLEVGALLPAHACALGKVLLAFDLRGAPALDELPLPRCTPRTRTTRADLTADLELVRARGWATDVGELVDGEAGVAAPVRDDRGAVVGAVGLCGAVERVCAPDGTPRAALVSAVRDSARAISRTLGFTGFPPDRG